MSSLPNVPQIPDFPQIDRPKRRHWHDLVHALAMVIGMVAREVGNSIAETGTIEIQLPRLVSVLIWAPTLYVAIFARLRQHKLSLLSLALAFQLGFFWTSILQAASGIVGPQHVSLNQP